MTEHAVRKLLGVPYIVWVYYYSEGWAPTPCESWEEAWMLVLNGVNQPCLITHGGIVPAPFPVGDRT